MIHHITAICSDADRTASFFVRELGLRLVKLTINQDDIGTYHLYFGDRLGRPGTVLTFFPWPQLPSGRVGPGMVSAVMFGAPSTSIDYWEERLSHLGVSREERFGLDVLSLVDPDGLPLLIVGHGDAGDWASHDVPAEHAINGFFGAELEPLGDEGTLRVLGRFGFRKESSDGALTRFVSGSDVGSVIDVREAPAAPPGRQGLGTVHHIAFRASDDDEQLRLRRFFVSEGLSLTPVIDRFYFKSVYFREPGGILFEIATDGPGFAVDEDADALGERLVLPPSFEPMRARIEGLLPPFSFP